MSMTSDAEMTTFNASIKMEFPELTQQLRETLGSKLTAYIGSVRETRAVRLWAEGKRTPSDETIQRLRVAFRVAEFIRQHESAAIAQTWFMGMNPQLDDVSPARLLREEQPDTVTYRLLAAARGFVGGA